MNDFSQKAESHRGLGHGVALSTIGNAVLPLSALVVAPFLARGLGVDGRGAVAAATAPLIFGVAALGLGVPEAMTYFVASRRRLSRRTILGALSVCVLVGVAIAAIVHLFSLQLAGGHRSLAALIAIATWWLPPALAVGFLRGAAAGYGRWRLIATERIVVGATRLLGVVALFLLDSMSVLAVVIVMAGSYATGLIVYGLGRVWRSDLLGVEDTAVGVRAMARYAGAIWLGSLSGIILSRVDQLLMTPLADVHELGIYVVAVNLSEVVLIFNYAVRDVIFSAESTTADVSRVAAAARVSTGLTLAGSIAVVAASPWFVPLLFGDEFNSAIPVLLILAGGVVLGNPGSVAGVGLSARGRPGLRSRSLVIAAIVNVVLLIALLPSLGAVGAAFATLAGNLIAGALNVVWLASMTNSDIRSFVFPRKSDALLALTLAKRMSVGLGLLRRPIARKERGR